MSRCEPNYSTVLSQILAAIQAQGELVVSDIASVVPGIGVSNLGKVHDGDFSEGASVGVFALAVRNDSAAVINNEDLGFGAIAVSDTGAVKIDASVTAAAITSVIPGTGATNLGKAEDAAAVSGDTGVAALFRRTDTATAQTGADGDYTFGVTNSFGAIHLDLNSDFRASATKSPVKVGASAYVATDTGMAAAFHRNTSLSATASSNTYNNGACGTYAQVLSSLVHDTNIALSGQVSKLEDSASTSGDAGLAALAVRQDTLASSVSTDGDYGFLKFDALGALWVRDREYTRFKGTSATITTTASTPVVAAPGAGLAYRITNLSLSNIDDDIYTRVSIYSGATKIWQFPAAVQGGGATQCFPKEGALECGTNEAINAVCEDSGADVQVSAAGFIV